MKSPLAFVVSAVVAVAGMAALPTAAAATNGTEALSTCRHRSLCTGRTNPDNGTITIVTGDGSVIWCPSATEECIVVATPSRTGARPTPIPGARVDRLLAGPGGGPRVQGRGR